MAWVPKTNGPLVQVPSPDHPQRPVSGTVQPLSILLSHGAPKAGTKSWSKPWKASGGSIGAQAGSTGQAGDTHSRSDLPDSMTDLGDPQQPLSLIPLSHAKIVHFIRHGEGFHNIGFEGNKDAHLTAFGWRQTQAVAQHLKTLDQPLNIQVVVVSPLVRTLETASGIFGAGSLSAYQTRPLMMPTQAVQNECVKHDAIAADKCPPFVACELCRERVGPNPCDRRRLLKLTKTAFPAVDFSEVRAENDDTWDAIHVKPNPGGIYPTGESEEEVTIRGMQFLQWLMKRPESRIAVVSHAGFLRHMLAEFAEQNRQDDSLVREFNNCELRSVVLSGGEVPAHGTKNATAFIGGRQWLSDPRFKHLA